MAAISKEMELWFLVVIVIFGSTMQVDSQLDSKGFISIDCGLASNSSLIDSETKLTFMSDDQFIDTGVNYGISSQYATNSVLKKYLTVRSFPNGIRNCYTLRSLTVGSKYLIRGLFMYGNYDKLNILPTFDVHLGVNYWDTVEITSADGVVFTEIITTITSDYLQVCLINKKLGTPFISTLELRPILKTSNYVDANSTQSLVLYKRLNLGGSNILRYPDDAYDQIWRPYMQETWKNISTSSIVDTDPDIISTTPSPVMQTAATTFNITQSLDLYWTSTNKSTKFLIFFHICEIQDIQSTDHRLLNIFGNGFLLYNYYVVREKLYSGWGAYSHQGYNEYNVSLKAASNSTLPPLLNVFEVFVITADIGIPTNSEDVSTLNTIKANYKVNKGWSGDPCSPKELTWSGVTCTSNPTKTSRIISLNLSSSGLTGAIIYSFGNLSALQSLDLSGNDLSGDIPTFLDKLSSLTYLDVTGNDKISTTLPPGLQSKKQDGNLIFKFGKLSSPRKRSPLIIPIAIAAVVVLLLIGAAIIIVLYLKRRKHNQSNNPKQIESCKTTPQANIHQLPNDANTPEANTQQGNIAGQNVANVFKPNEPGEGILDFENRRFSYNDLIIITNEFKKNIGTGGFGSVYVGTLENGTRVAVKMRSHSSSQGVKEFLAEAQNLGRVHHKYLVSLIGYCMDGDCMALVYEYMQEGTLQDKLMDTARPLSWKQRVEIAYESAIGLEYLHKACNPPLIHRDVKSSNILLNENLEARVADFGLSRAISNAASSHVSTVVVGTPSYLDPEYYSLCRLSEKSDVFSFGVVLLEIITGQPSIIPGPEGGHLKQWVNQKLSRGEIESIADPIMHGQYDINSVWKVTDLACRCTDNSSAHRPTMCEVVTELKESLDLEISTEGTRGRNTTPTNPNNYSRKDRYGNDVSQNSVYFFG